MTDEQIREAVEFYEKWGIEDEVMKPIFELAQDYLSLKGWPEEKKIMVSKYYEARGFNEALRLCKLAVMKMLARLFVIESDWNCDNPNCGKGALCNFCAAKIQIKALHDAIVGKKK
jgi:hypothetical protein